MGLLGCCNVADGAETQEWNTEVVAYLGDGSGFHIAAQSVRIESLDLQILFQGRDELVSGTDKTFMDSGGAVELVDGFEQFRIRIESLWESLNLTAQVTLAAPDIVIGNLGSHNEIADFQDIVDSSGNSGVDDAVGVLAQDQLGRSPGGIDLAYSGHYHVVDSTFPESFVLTLHGNYDSNVHKRMDFVKIKGRRLPFSEKKCNLYARFGIKDKAFGPKRRTLYLKIKSIIMKKIIIAAIALLASASAFAQVSVGAGYVSDATKSSVTVGNSTTTTNGSANGVYVGADYNYSLGQGLGVAAGAKFAFLGNKNQSELLGIVTTNKLSEMYLGIPVNVNYTYELSKDLKVSAFAGPTFNFGLSSKNTITNNKNDDKTVVDNYGDDSKYGKTNVFVGAGVAVDVMEMIRVKVGYDLGLLNRTSADKCKLTENQLYFGVAYLF